MRRLPIRRIFMRESSHGGLRMTIEIHKPELEALILSRMRLGEFQSIEDMLLHVLESVERPSRDDADPEHASTQQSGAELIAAMQASPYKEIDLEPQRHPFPVSESRF